MFKNPPVPNPLKPTEWLGDSKATLRSFPEEVKDDVGTAIHWAQRGEKHPDSKVMKGFGGAGVVEVVANFDGDTYRAVYTAKFETALYVLHCFQKKSKKGIATPRNDLEMVRKRFKEAKKLEEEAQQKRKKVRK